MNLYEVMELWNALGKVKDKKMPVKISFAISRNISLLSPEVRDIQRHRTDIIQKYIERDPDGNPVVDTDGGAKISDPEGLEKDLDALLSEHSDIAVRTVSESVFEACDADRYDAFTPGEISALSAMIEYTHVQKAEEK